MVVSGEDGACKTIPTQRRWYMRPYMPHSPHIQCGIDFFISIINSKGIKRYKLLGIKQRRYKDIMYSTGDIANIL